MYSKLFAPEKSNIYTASSLKNFGKENIDFCFDLNDEKDTA